jgi:hypothetical protein
LNQCEFSESYHIHTRINNDIAATLSRKFKITDPIPGGDDFTIRKFNIFRFRKDLEILREINNDAFDHNWHFLPLSKEEYRFSAQFLFLVTSPRLILIVEHHGKPAGAIQCVINFNKLIKPLNGRMKFWEFPGLLFRRKNVKELVIFTVGVKKAFQRNTVVISLIVRSALKIFQDYSVLSTTWMSDENKGVNHFSELLEMKPYKHFAIYSKKL